jgi:CTP:molybdopterin cytidylyltransferase MocA
MEKQPLIAAVVTAGWNQKKDDPLTKFVQEGSKAMIPIAGKPMIGHVVDALTASRYIKHLVIVALNAKWGIKSPFQVEYLPDSGDLVNNALSGIRYALEAYSADAVLVCSSDIPTITSDIVDAFIADCLDTEHDVYYSIIERSIMENRFPQSRRSYIHLRDGDFAGGDISFFRPSVHFNHQALMQKLAQARKSPLRQASMLGPAVFFKLLIHRLSIAEAEKRVHQLFRVKARAVPCPYAEIGMDVDKPFQLEIVRAELEIRASKAAF